MPGISPAIANLSNILPDLPKLVPAFKSPIPDRLLKEIKAQQESKKRAFSETTESLDKLSSIKVAGLMKLDPIFAIGADYKGVAQALSANFGRILEEHARISQASGRILEKRTRIYQAMADSLKDSSAFLDEEEFGEFEYNWLFFLPIPQMKEFYESWKAGKLGDVEEFFRNGFSQDETISKLLTTFDDNEFFKPRIHIIGDALNAHLAGKYTLSIPVILSQVDGIFIERYSRLEGEIVYTCQECGYKRKAPLNARNISEHLANRESVYFAPFLKHIMDTFVELRNKILHGIKLDYPDVDLSTKLILTLLELYYSTQHKLTYEILDDAIDEFPKEK